MERARGMTMAFRQWALGIGLMTVIAGGLTACGGQQTSAPPTTAPATTLPAVTESAPTTAPASPALKVTTAVASPVREAMPAVASPVGAATAVTASPVARSAAGATPVAEVNPQRLAAACADYNAWRNNADVKAALAKMSLWPEVIAEGEKAAAGQPVDTALMKQDFDQMENLAKQLRTANLPESDHAPLQLSGRAMGLTSRLAGGLATGSLDAKGAADSVAAAKEAIAAYQEDAAKRQAECG
jgi:hypothetical protein